MKYWFALFFVLIIYDANAKNIIVEDIKISVQAESAIAAREQAIDQAHQLAFQKLINENFPDKRGVLPSIQMIKESVIDFSIDREKATPTNYAAVLTFQFDGSLVIASIYPVKENISSPYFDHLAHESNSLKILASYDTHAEWQNIKKTLEDISFVENLSVSSISLKSARLEIIFAGTIDKLKEDLVRRGISLFKQKAEWTISLIGQTLH